MRIKFTMQRGYDFVSSLGLCNFDFLASEIHTVGHFSFRLNLMLAWKDLNRK